MAPLYEFSCEECTNLDTLILPLDERNKSRECSRCGGISKRIFSPCADRKEFTPYYEKRTGKIIGGRMAEAKSDKRNKRVSIRDAKWFKPFTKEFKDKQRQPSGQRRFETLGAKVK